VPGTQHADILANDHVPSAVDEIVWTARNAELLKQEAGIRGWRARDGKIPVKHLSLNWSPRTIHVREHMIETRRRNFCATMKWQELRPLLVAPTIRLRPRARPAQRRRSPQKNRLRLDDNFERRRAQTWALEYERSKARLLRQRLKILRSVKNAPREIFGPPFRKMKRNFEQAENRYRKMSQFCSTSRYESKKTANGKFWIGKFSALERTDFFAEGKSEFSALRLSIYREVREEVIVTGWARPFYAASQGRRRSGPSGLP